MLRVLAVLALVLSVLAPRGAKAQGIGQFVSPGALSRDHAELDNLVGCPKCHAPGRAPGDPGPCLACHEPVKRQIETRTGFHKDKGQTCRTCHPEHRGRDFELVRIEESTFDHEAETGWPLEGEHGDLRCIECHTNPDDYTGLSRECASCHDDPHNRRESKRDVLGDCANCHRVVRDWRVDDIEPQVFDHTSKADADYLLEGQHVEVGCGECHVDMKFLHLAFETCTDCHVNSHRAKFKEEACESCHPNSQTWEVEGFDHNRTNYPLRGGHRGVACERCHKGDKTDPLSHRCESCHADVHRGQFAPKGCDDCHTVQTFSMKDFDHDTTDFPLRGKHVENTCEQCHGEGRQARYVDLAHADCDDCHDDEHEGRFQPTDCAMCHITDGFDVQAFDHDRTSFRQTGKHVGLDCNKCHRDYQWNGIPHESCVDCHYTRNPHRPVITADQCDGCHTTTGFADMVFDHAGNTDFDLRPAHTTLECQGCHKVVYHFAGLDQACTACHTDDRPWGHYEGECGGCHEAEHWYPGGLGGRDHGITGFALQASHSLLPCESCHPPGEPRGEAPAHCVGCHWSDDPHLNLLGTACADCHGEMSWFRTTFRHTSTGWPLRGAHRLAACIDCHAVGYVGTPTDCWRCHEAEAPLDVPAHQTPAFQLCDTCHRAYTWDAPGYPH